MTTTKEETINKLSNLTWQRKLNIRNLGVNCRTNSAVTGVAKIERLEKTNNRDKSDETPAQRSLVADKNKRTENETPDRVVREENPGGEVRSGEFAHTGYDKRCQRFDEKENLGYNTGKVPPSALNGTRRRRRLSVVNAAQNINKNCRNVQHCDDDDDGNTKAKGANRNDDNSEPKPVSGTNYTVRQKLMRASKCLQLNRDESNVHRDVVLEHKYPSISSEVLTGIQFQYSLNQEPNRKDYHGDDEKNGNYCRYEGTSSTEQGLLNLVASQQNYVLPNEKPNPDKYGHDENQNKMNWSRSSYHSHIPPPLHGSSQFSEEPRPIVNPQQNHFIRYNTLNSSCGDSYTNSPATISCARFQSNKRELTKNGGEISNPQDYYDDEAITRQFSLFNATPATLSRPLPFQLDSKRPISTSQNHNHDAYEGNLRVYSYAYANDSNNDKGGDGGFTDFLVTPTNGSHSAWLVNDEACGDRRYLAEKHSDDNRHSYFNAANSDLTPAMQKMNIHNVAKLLYDVNNGNHATVPTMVITPEARDISPRAATVNDIAFQRYDLFETSSNFHSLENERPCESRPSSTFCVAKHKTGIATNLGVCQKFNDLDGNFSSSPGRTIASSSSSSSSSSSLFKNSNGNLGSEILIVSSNKEPFDSRSSCERMSRKGEVKNEVGEFVGEEISTTSNSYAKATRPQQPSTFKKNVNLIRRAKDDVFNDRIRFSRPRRDSMTINVKDDCFINFDRKAFENYVSFKLNPPPTVGILKKSTKWQSLPLSECSIQFTRSHADEGVDEVDVLLKESKKVSFSPYVHVTE